MRTSKRLTLLSLAVSMTLLVGSVATPSVADEPRSGPVVLNDLGPDVTLEEMHARAERIGGERLPDQASQLTIVDSPAELTVDQLATVAAGKEADGVRRLGDVRDLSPSTSLQDVARQIGVGTVVLQCIVIKIVVGPYVFVIWICRIVVIKA